MEPGGRSRRSSPSLATRSIFDGASSSVTGQGSLPFLSTDDYLREYDFLEPRGGQTAMDSRLARGRRRSWLSGCTHFRYIGLRRQRKFRGDLVPLPILKASGKTVEGSQGRNESNDHR
mmetsp:Transcript_8380/g.17063  ORF Transcript_8380/g.17063 Transcript_8380/m.17063 type:complete len:118 (-) Transcript_8380:402-755(-)